MSHNPINKTIKKYQQKINKLPKRIKIILSTTIILVLLIILFISLKSMTSPQKIVQKYLDAIIEENYSKLYHYEDYHGDKTFINKEIYTAVVKQQIKENATIKNYTIDKINYDDNNETAIIPISMTLEGNNSTKSTIIEIELTKEKRNKYLFFPNWTITKDELLKIETQKDFNITVPKGTTVTFSGIELKEKYINNKNKNDNITTYTLPQVLNTQTKVTFELPNNIKINKEINPGDYETGYSLEISLEDLSKANQKKLTKTITNTTEKMIEATTDNKSFSDINSIFVNSSNSEYYQKLKEEYTSYKNNMTANTVYSLSNFKINGLEISSIEFTRNYELSILVRLDYTWEQTEKTSKIKTQEENHSYHRFYLLPEQNQYKITGISSFPTTISWTW